VLLYAVEWDSTNNARRYFDAYRTVLQKKWKSFAVKSELADAVTGTGDAGGFELRISGLTITSVEGLSPAIN
jgi:hypothetical protein